MDEKPESKPETATEEKPATAVPLDADSKPRLRHPDKAKRVAVAQIAPTLGDTKANMEAHLAMVERARGENIDLLVFPELSFTGYRLKDTVPELALSKGSQEIADLAKLSQEISIVIGLVEEDLRHNVFNSAFLFEGGHVQHVHRKAYLPTYGMFDEQRYFARGRSLAAFNCKIGRAAILICEDMLHPTAVTIAALDGASTIIVPSASPAKGVTGDAEAEVDANGRHWETYNRAMARTLGLNIIYANRVGVEDGIAFWGGSEVIGPGGDTLAKAKYYEEDFVVAQLTEEAVRRRRIQAPVLRDENVDLTINELARLIGRNQLPDARQEDRRPGGPPRFGDRDRAPRGRDDRGGPRGRDDRGPRGRDDRGPRRSDDRSGPPRGRDDRGPRRPDDRGGPPRGRDDRPRDDRRGDDRRRDDRPRGPRDDRPQGPSNDRRRDDRGPRPDRRRDADIETGRLKDAIEDARREKRADVTDGRAKRAVDETSIVAEPKEAAKPTPKSAPEKTTESSETKAS